MNDIKLVITDIDGVWTDGGMYYDNDGNEWKKFNTSDSGGVVMLRMLDIPVAIISGEDTEILRRRAQKLKIKHLFMGIKDKLAVAQDLCEKLGLDLSKDVAYIGDDINDILLLQAVKISATPQQAPLYVQRYAQWVMSKKGGEGAFREFVEKILGEQKIDEVLEYYLNTLRKTHKS